MLHKQKLFVFPTSRSIRSFLNEQKGENTLLPFCLTIDEFLKKSINLSNKKYIDEEQRILYLNKAIKNIDINKLGISNSFSKFLKQSDYIYRFFLELASENVSIEDMKISDTYEYYHEHLEILEKIRSNYVFLLEENNCVDKINLSKNYSINEEFLKKFDNVNIYFEGYFTKEEFEIINKISSYVNLTIEFYSNEYNQKSLEKFTSILDIDFELDYKYKIDLSNKALISNETIKSNINTLDIKGFSSRTNQIAYIKSTISKCEEKGIDPSLIAVVLPDEQFSSTLELFDNEEYFNYAMGKSIKNSKIYQVANAIFLYLNEDEIKNKKNIEYLNLDTKYIDTNIKSIWKNVCDKDVFTSISSYIKSFETNDEILEKYDDFIYKLNILLFSSLDKILLKDIYKIFLQKLLEIKLDDINSGKVTVLGLLETRTMSYEALIICDFNENFIPKSSVKDKFLSTKLKQDNNLPTSNDREMLQKYYYKRLIESSKNVYISYVNSETNRISRFANELFPNKDSDKVYDNEYSHILYNNHNITHFNEDIIDNIDLSKMTWSATSLKVFLQCKRKFYLQYILKLEDHNISLKPKAYELGNIVHEILEKYYTPDENSNELTFEKIESLFNEYKTNNAFLILDLEVWKKKLYEFYLYDMKRLEHKNILALEKPFNIVIDDIKIKGVIDRIDKDGDSFDVIDYKTSSSLKVDSLKNFEKANDFQLEFYYLAMSELYKTDKINAYYYDLHNTLLIEEIALDKKLELLMSKFDEIKELSKSSISFTKCEEKSNCTFCPYLIVCNRE